MLNWSNTSIRDTTSRLLIYEWANLSKLADMHITVTAVMKKSSHKPLEVGDATLLWRSQCCSSFQNEWEGIIQQGNLTSTLGQDFLREKTSFRSVKIYQTFLSRYILFAENDIDADFSVFRESFDGE